MSVLIYQLIKSPKHPLESGPFFKPFGKLLYTRDIRRQKHSRLFHFPNSVLIAVSVRSTSIWPPSGPIWLDCGTAL